MRAAWPDVRRYLRPPLVEQNWYAFFNGEMIIPADNAGIGKHELRNIGGSGNLRRADSASVGVWSIQNLPTHAPGAFYFRLFDLCAVCAGIVGFVLGFMNFTIRPS
jgi:hypothetical protein